MGTNGTAISRRIYSLIEAQGTSRAAIADQAGIPTTSFYRKLDRTPEEFSVRDLGLIANALGVTLPTLIEGEAA